MVREYVTELYRPAARSSAALADRSKPGGPAAGEPASYAAARELAAWKHRVTAAWPGVRVEHVEADEIIDPICRPLARDSDASADGVVRYAGVAELGEPGPFGYTVRALPSHPLLSDPAELGLITIPAATTGMVNGDLR